VVVKATFLLDSESRIRAALLAPPGEPVAGGRESGHAAGHGDGADGGAAMEAVR
jgi:hypothetical protein